MIRHFARDVALGEVLARRFTERIVPEHLLEVGGRGRVYLPVWLARIRTFATRLDFPDFDSRLLADHLDGGRPLDPESLLEEAEHVAAFVADEAVVHPLLR